MTRPAIVIGFVNAGHFIDHYAMLVFATAVVVMAPAFGMSYAELLPYAAPGFFAFGAGALLTGWLGDRWSRRHMMVVFFLGIGAALMSVAATRTPVQLGASLLAVGLFASIYHPVGTAMLVSYADKVGRSVGINGLWGNFGVAASALATGAICDQAGWRWAFLLPGLVSIAIGLLFMRHVPHESRTGRAAAVPPRVSKQAMRRVVLSLVITIVASSTAFNAVTVALPKLFTERLPDLAGSPALIGLVTAFVYVFGAAAQAVIGRLIDRHSLRAIFLPLSVLLAPLFFLGAGASGGLLVLVAIGVIIGIFGQVTINDAMVARYTSDEWRSRAYAARYFLGFTAAGASVGLVAWLHAQGGFTLMLQAFGVLCLLVLAGALIFPSESPASRREAQPAE